MTTNAEAPSAPPLGSRAQERTNPKRSTLGLIAPLGTIKPSFLLWFCPRLAIGYAVPSGQTSSRPTAREPPHRALDHAARRREVARRAERDEQRREVLHRRVRVRHPRRALAEGRQRVEVTGRDASQAHASKSRDQSGTVPSTIAGGDERQAWVMKRSRRRARPPRAARRVAARREQGVGPVGRQADLHDGTSRRGTSPSAAPTHRGLGPRGGSTTAEGRQLGVHAGAERAGVGSRVLHRVVARVRSPRSRRPSPVAGVGR